MARSALARWQGESDDQDDYPDHRRHANGDLAACREVALNRFDLRIGRLGQFSTHTGLMSLLYNSEELS